MCGINNKYTKLVYIYSKSIPFSVESLKRLGSGDYFVHIWRMTILGLEKLSKSNLHLFSHTKLLHIRWYKQNFWQIWIFFNTILNVSHTTNPISWFFNFCKEHSMYQLYQVTLSRINDSLATVQ